MPIRFSGCLPRFRLLSQLVRKDSLVGAHSMRAPTPRSRKLAGNSAADIRRGIRFMRFMSQFIEDLLFSVSVGLYCQRSSTYRSEVPIRLEGVRPQRLSKAKYEPRAEEFAAVSFRRATAQASRTSLGGGSTSWATCCCHFRTAASTSSR